MSELFNRLAEVSALAPRLTIIDVIRLSSDALEKLIFCNLLQKPITKSLYIWSLGLGLWID